MEDKELKQTTQDPLSLEIKDDKRLVEILKDRVKTSQAWFNSEKDLDKRVKRNKKYYFGRQVKEDELKAYEGRWLDNIIWEAGKTTKAVSLSKMPDLIVHPGSDSPEAEQTAEQLSRAIDTDIKRRESRIVLAMAFQHRPVYFRGVIKYRWNPEKGKGGDYEFEAINPENITVDHTAKTNDAQKMEFVDEKQMVSLKELIMRFPDKKEQIILEAAKDGVQPQTDNELSDKGLATEVEIHETWFDWYDQQGEEWEKVSSLAVRYRDLLLYKGKNPNWDWSGQKQTFSYGMETKEEDYRSAVLLGSQIPGFSAEMFHSNYFESPEKPYIFLNHDLWGDSPIDETSWVEQLVLMQFSLDSRGKVIQEKLANRTKHVFSKEGGIKPEDIEEMDMNDPDQDILIDDDVNKFHSTIAPDLPTAQEFKDYEDTRNRMFSKAGTFATRGEMQTDVATSNQIAREADFTRADDQVEETINYAAEMMARARLQLIKLRYTEDHFVRTIGSNGKSVRQRLHRDMIEDGMEVQVTASGTDKLKAERRAQDMAAAQLIDPYTFFKDIGASDPKGRTEKLILWLSDPNQYMAKVVMGLENSQQMATALNGPGGAQQAQADIQLLMQGQMPPVPQPIDPEYLQVFTQFMQSPDFQALPPEVQQIFSQFAEQLISQTDQEVAAAPGNQFGKPATAPVLPSPGNTSAMPTSPAALPQGSTRAV